MSFWTYMLHCRDGYFYVGHTDNLECRMAQHASGDVPGFAADHWPGRLVWSEQFSTRDEALMMERRIKGWKRAKKLALIRGDWTEISRLAKSSPSTSSGRTDRRYPPGPLPVRAEPVGPNGVKENDNPPSVRPELVEGLHLVCHPDTPARSVQSVEVAVQYHSGRWLLGFEVVGDTPLVSPRAAPARTDGLWRTTCFELFVGTAGEGYAEYNFSPSTQWAAYAFTRYREGMTPLPIDPPLIEPVEKGIRVTLDFPVAAIGQVRLGLSAVIEEQDGTKSWWALAHPPGKPDFHHPACFALELPAPEPI